jgi:hypothetical protein
VVVVVDDEEEEEEEEEEEGNAMLRLTCYGANAHLLAVVAEIQFAMHHSTRVPKNRAIVTIPATESCPPNSTVNGQ